MLNLATRKRLAAPFYWLAGVFLTLANKVDGPQPRKRKVRLVDIPTINEADYTDVPEQF